MKYLAENMRSVTENARIKSKLVLYRALQHIEDQANRGCYNTIVWCNTKNFISLKNDLLDLNYRVRHILDNDSGSTKFDVDWGLF